ncbi:hypothetical protein [Moheibacter sediminis]|uniref:O-antigen ligase n=1 Tax=Moheibacter sediminis TaxID=1434700 RepID=A0A1W1YAW2_9FLAO|nr:hypothetical protein [Moheibacter sediminis]SMC33350.1 hypothetical protein SAMN06296427_101208 [Moheibacter sediminis]
MQAEPITIQNTRNNHLRNIMILFPAIIIIVSEILMYFQSPLSSPLKVAAVFYMMFYAILKVKYHGGLIFSLMCFLPFFIYAFVISFNINAAIEEGIRYLFPISILLYSYALKRDFKFLLYSFIIFVLINDAWQIVNYINWMRGGRQWFYTYNPYWNTWVSNETSGIIRATGIVGFFGLFGFINMLAFFLTKRYYQGKGKLILLIIFVVCMFLSFSYKTLGTFLLMIFLEMKNKMRILLYVLGIGLIAFITMPKLVLSMEKNARYRIMEYVVEGNSARGDSYRVMFEEIGRFNLFGRGIGAFGGPSSVRYNSPVYKEVKFNWYTTPELTTTDTYYPHLFVEMGIIGGLSYMFIIVSPLIFLRWNYDKFKIVFVIYFALLFDALFAYSINNIAYLILSLIFIYPIYYYNEQPKNP